MRGSTPEFAGFWRRACASLVDTVFVLVTLFPLHYFVYGPAYVDSDDLILGPADVLISWVGPAVAHLWFWRRLRATPGKLLFRACVVDAETGGTISLRQGVVRYLGYFLSLLPVGLGFVWIAFDPRKQGWHDKLAGTVTVVVPTPRCSARPSEK